MIDGDPVLQQITAYVKPRLEGDPGHDFGHALRVAHWTIQFGERKFAHRLAVAAALLHDVVNLPKNHPERALASEKSSVVAYELLNDLGLAASDIDLVCGAIRDHSFSLGKVPESFLGKCLQDADRLEALGALGVFRLISTGTKMEASYFHSEDPWATAREYDDKKYSLDHFFTKLLKLPQTMNTEAGRKEADKRAQFLRVFIDQLGDEILYPRVLNLDSASSAEFRYVI